MSIDYYESPIGLLKIQTEDQALVLISFVDEIGKEKTDQDPLMKEVKKQLGQYFNGDRQRFELPICLNTGTPFMQSVWQELMNIEYGQTTYYQAIAERLNRPKACRAIGQANHNNPISIIIPCHRVIGKNQQLVGYGGGLDKKIALLALEERILALGGEK